MSLLLGAVVSPSLMSSGHEKQATSFCKLAMALSLSWIRNLICDKSQKRKASNSWSCRNGMKRESSNSPASAFSSSRYTVKRFVLLHCLTPARVILRQRVKIYHGREACFPVGVIFHQADRVPLEPLEIQGTASHTEFAIRQKHARPNFHLKFRLGQMWQQGFFSKSKFCLSFHGDVKPNPTHGRPPMTFFSQSSLSVYSSSHSFNFSRFCR